MCPPTLNLIEPPWYGPVCPVVWEGWHREVSPYPDQSPEPLAKPFCVSWWALELGCFGCKP